MGWFDINSSGHSFTGSMTWGDGPADIMGDILASLPEGTTVGEVRESFKRVFDNDVTETPLDITTATATQEFIAEFGRIGEKVDFDTVLAGVAFATGDGDDSALVSDRL